MDIVDALTHHHHTLRALAAQAEDDPSAFEEYLRHLQAHHTLEERYFYDFLERKPDAEHDSLEAVNEHHIIELIIKDAEDFPREHSRFPIKVEGLAEYTNHHLDEEELEIFPLARTLFPAEELAAMGALFQEALGVRLGEALPPPDLKRAAAQPPAADPADAGEQPLPIGVKRRGKPRECGAACPDLGIGSLRPA